MNGGKLVDQNSIDLPIEHPLDPIRHSYAPTLPLLLRPKLPSSTNYPPRSRQHSYLPLALPCIHTIPKKSAKPVVILPRIRPLTHCWYASSFFGRNGTGVWFFGGCLWHSPFSEVEHEGLRRIKTGYETASCNLNGRCPSHWQACTDIWPS